MGTITVTDQAGARHVLDAVEGWRVMEIIRAHGLAMEGLCGGACVCATCHVVVDDAWLPKLHAARDDEEAMLDTVPVLEPGSRLSCQLIYGEHLDGLALRLAADGVLVREAA
jgi:2Fe-2S ferredoxin